MTARAMAPISDAERQGLLARIFAKCEEDGDCLLWRGCFSDSGVPQVSFRVAPGCLRLMTVTQLRKIDAARGAFNTAHANAVRLLSARRRAVIPEELVALVRSHRREPFTQQKHSGKPLSSPWSGLVR